MMSAGEPSGSGGVAQRLATVDIGTNTIKFSVFGIDGQGAARLLASDAETVRLGADIDQTGMIGDERSRRAIGSLQRFERDARMLGANALIGVATEAFRSASNGADVLAAIHGSTGWRLRVIDGLEEARLTFRGLQSRLPRSGACIVADVGGGSTELLHVTDRSLIHSESIPIGSGRFADTYFAGSAPTDGTIAMARQAARLAILRSLPAGTDQVPLLLSGGNGLFLARLSQLVTSHPEFTNEALVAVAHELVIRSASEIADVLSISPERAAVLPAGCAIALGAMDAIASRELAAVPSGIREGILRDWLDSRGYADSGSAANQAVGQVE